MRNKGIAYRRMLISFAMVFVVPLCLVFAIYLFSYQVMEDQIEATNENFILTIQGVCDREIQYYQNVLMQLSLNERIETLSEKEALGSEDRITAANLIPNIYEASTSINALENECKDIFVYFPKVDMVISSREKGSIRFDTYAKITYPNDQAAVDSLQSYLSNYSRTGLINPSFGSTGNDMLLITYCSGRSGSMSEATLGIWLDLNALTKRIASVEWGHGYDWLIVNSDGQIVKGALDYDLEEGKLSLDRLSEEGIYMIYTAQSNVSEWTYVLLMPREMVRASAAKIQSFFAISVLISILIAYLLIKKATKLNYAPLENLLRAFKSKEDVAAGHNNEYQILNDQIRNLMSEKSNMESDISTNRKSLARLGLINLLVNPKSFPGGERNRAWEHLAERFPEEENQVLIIKEQAEGEDGMSQQFTQEVKMFIIENIFLEGIGEIISCSMIEIDGRQILVLNDACVRSSTEKVQERIFELQSIIAENFKLNLSIAVGAVHHGLEGIHQSYLEAREAEEFLPILDQDFISYLDIKDRTFRRYHYSLQAEERISAAVQNNNAQLAIALIHKVIDTNWADNHSSPNILKLLLHDIFCTLLKTADEKGCIDRIYMLPKNLGTHNPVAEIKEHFTKVVESICDIDETVSELSTERALCIKVLEYIQQNYSNPNLNVSQTAFYFRLSPTTLSATFKNETGKSLLVAINEIRIEAAIECLRQGCSVSETAEKVGIPESSSFIRLFKKYVGVTPGSMRTQMVDKK